MKKFLIVIEEGRAGYSAYSPDVPGCVATGRRREEVEQNMRLAWYLVFPTLVELYLDTELDVR